MQVLKNKYILILLFLSVILRFLFLGYSNYQGDEIKAFFIPEEGQTTWDFLLDQRKGPMQFIITYFIKILDTGYDNRILARLPFALAGVISVVIFYEFVGLHYGSETALYSALFFCTNGFLVAFSRIVQYQSFVIFFMVLCLYYLTLAVKDYRFRIVGLYLGLISWALSILSHYDGVFMAPFVFYLLYLWFSNIETLDKKNKIKHFIISGLISALLLLLFYIPFVMSISESTLEYWSGRLSGEVSTKISSSKYLFTVYQPIYVVHIYTILGVIGFLYIAVKVFPRLLLLTKKKGIHTKLKKVYPFSKDMFNVIFDKSFYQHVSKFVVLFIWFFIPFVFLECFVYIPGTHIYTYLIPLFIVLALGIRVINYFVYRAIKQRYKFFITRAGLSIMFLFIFAQAFTVFVEHNQEYPWEQEKFLIWTFPKPTPIFHLSMFGFPYYRNWEGIENFVKSYEDVEAYSTNERQSIARFHISLPKDSDKAGFYVYIKNPQSFTDEILSEKPDYWADKYPPDYTFSRNGDTLSRVYLMEPGSLEEIQQKGF